MNWKVIAGSLLAATVIGHNLIAQEAAPAPAPAVGGIAKPVSDKRVQEVKDLKFGMFVCWSFSTFSNVEWTHGVKSVDWFNPTGYDPEQWVKVAKDAGMGYILFLTKHHDGFCLWDTQTTDWKVTKSPLKRDALKELRAACDKHGIKLALYFSEGDWTQPNMRNPELKKAQLKELLTQYGPVEYIWFDHAQTDGGLSHDDTTAWCKQFQPDCFIGYNHGAASGDIRLGEMGRPGPLSDEKAAGFNSGHMKDYKGYRLAEFTYPILGGASQGRWFYTMPEWDGKAIPVETIYNDYLGAVKYGNVFALDVAPDRAGRIRNIDVERLSTVGKLIRGEIKLPAKPLSGKATASGTWGEAGFDAAKAVDGDFNTRWGAPENAKSGWLEIDLGAEKTVTQAKLDDGGYDRVRKFEIQAKIGNDWKTVAAGTAIGSKKTIVFPAPAKAQVFRLTILEATEVPTISEFQLFE
jgi:alpha-L-fucosidase